MHPHQRAESNEGDTNSECENPDPRESKQNSVLLRERGLAKIVGDVESLLNLFIDKDAKKRSRHAHVHEVERNHKCGDHGDNDALVLKVSA